MFWACFVLQSTFSGLCFCCASLASFSGFDYLLSWWLKLTVSLSCCQVILTYEHSRSLPGSLIDADINDHSVTKVVISYLASDCRVISVLIINEYNSCCDECSVGWSVLILTSATKWLVQVYCARNAKNIWMDDEPGTYVLSHVFM